MNIEQIKKILQSATPKYHRWKVELLSRWNEVVGKFEKVVFLEGFAQNCIFIGVANPCLAKEFMIQKELLSDKISSIVGPSQSFEIKIRLSATKKPLGLIKKKKSLVCRKNFEKIGNLSIEEKQALSKIKTTALREAMHSFWIRCKKVSSLKR